MSDHPPSARPGARTSPADDPTGTVLGDRYRFDRLLAAGGMAQVWEGTDLTLGRKVAVKRLHPHLAADDSFVARFRQEAVAAAKVSHPSIVSIYDTYSGEGDEAIVMELVRGVTLRQQLDRAGALEPATAAEITAQAAEALDVAHRAGLVHRDVKPGNILLCDDRRVKVADFGIAKAAEGADLTQEGMMLGTAKYLAPEQVQGGPVDARTDVYALGVVLYEMLCGQPPFAGDTDAATALARLHQDPPRARHVRASVPRALDDVAHRAMARDPAARHPSAAELRAAVLAAVRSPGPGADATVLSTADPTPQPSPAPATGATVAAGAVAPTGGGRDDDPGRSGPGRPRRSLLLPALVAVLVLVALAVGALLVRQGLSDSSFFTGGDDDGGSESSGSATELAIAQVATFDPASGGGDGAENDELASQAADTDLATDWPSEGYDDPMERQKDGVGLVFALDGPASLDELTVLTGNTGWSGEVYVADGSPASLEGWGAPVATLADQGNEATFALDGAEGSSVLLWFTSLGDRLDDGKFRARVGEVVLLGDPA